MKAQELNGTHIGQTISVQFNGAQLSDVLREVSHEADLIAETTFDGRDTSALGRKSTRLHFQHFGSVKVGPDAVIIFRSNTPARGAHHLTENANADPICHCGWDPARETFPVVRSREQARNDIRLHIADSKGAQ